MITVTVIRRASNKKIVSFAIEGHAKYAKPGKDIVCAGVSAISVGTVNAIEQLVGEELPCKMKNGWLSADIPLLTDESSDARMQLLLESMFVMLDTIVQSYGKHVVIHQHIE